MNLWERILSTLQHKIDDQSFTTWLKPTQQVSVSDGTLRVEVPSALFADWITKNYQSLIDESARGFYQTGLCRSMASAFLAVFVSVYNKGRRSNRLEVTP